MGYFQTFLECQFNSYLFKEKLKFGRKISVFLCFQLLYHQKVQKFAWGPTIFCGELAPYPWHCPSSIVRRVSSVSTITTRNNEAINSIFSANVNHVPGLCPLGIGGARYISHKIMAQKTIFSHFRLLL